MQGEAQLIIRADLREKPRRPLNSDVRRLARANYMGYEYLLRIPEESREAISGTRGEEIVSALRALDPSVDASGANVTIAVTGKGLYLCDHLSNRSVANQVLGQAITLLLASAASVTVEEL